MRKRLFQIIEKQKGQDFLSICYDLFMLVIITISMIPLASKEETLLFTILDKISALVFIVDYILRWMTADLKDNSHGAFAFIRYPFTFMAIIDLLAILPSISAMNRGFRILKTIRMFRALRVMRIFKIVRYSKSIEIISNVLHSSRDSLLAVCTMAAGYIFLSAMIIFNIEPDSFNNFFDAVYWATVSLTTVGYGDIYPISTLGRIIAMISSVFGIAIVALPAGIITAGYMNELQNSQITSSSK